MKTLKVLLATSTALVMAGTATPTLARSKASSVEQSLAAQKAEINALKAQLQMLQQQVAAQSAAQQSAQSQSQEAAAQATQAASTAAEAKAAAAQAQTAATSAQATAEKAKGDSSALAKAASWAADTKVSGRMYFNISSVSKKVDGAKTEQDGGFSIKRFYLGVDHKFNDMFSGDITTDVSSVSGVGQTLYIKKAFLQAKIDPALVIRLGATDMPWIPYAEGVYGYRHIEQTLTDRTKFGTSSDWGVHVMGDLANGLISYQVSAVDGGGYRNPQFTKTIDLEGRVSLKYKGIEAAVGGYTGKLGKDTGATTYHTADRFNALLAYKTKMFTVGGEYFTASNWSQVTSATSDKSDGFSLFGNVNFAPKWSAFGRYDWVKPKKDTNNGLKDEYLNVGIQYSPAKIVDLALVYKHDKAKNGTISTGNGTIGGAISGTYDEIGLFGQFRF